MQEIGREFGVTTGRRRRCGWIDLPQLKYADCINHFTALAITKLDVMDTFETVAACIGYLDAAGNEVEYMPSSLKKLAEVKPKLKEFPGWKCDTTKCTTVQPNIFKAC